MNGDYPWQYDETAQSGTDYRNENEVRAYDERMQRLRNLRAEADDIQRALSLSPDSTVWEIGAGTGECALTVASMVKHVYATDVSPAMLDFARQKAKQRHVANITFERGGFLTGFRPEGPVDGIVTQLSLHHLPDFWKLRAFESMAMRLRPKGRLYLHDVVFPSNTDDYDSLFQSVIDEIGAKAGEEAARQSIQHIKAEFSTLDWVLEGMIARCGLRILEKNVKGVLSVYLCEK